MIVPTKSWRQKNRKSFIGLMVDGQFHAKGEKTGDDIWNE